MTWILLKFIDFLKPIYVWQGVDFAQLRAIVGVKLEMDNRRVPSFRMNQQQKEQSNGLSIMLFFYGIMGLLPAVLIYGSPSLIFSFTFYHSFLMVMITTALISDFSSILLDTSDNTIVLPRPVTGKTFYAARTTHILLYLGQICTALLLPSIITSILVKGSITGLIVLITSVLNIIFSVSLTNGLYLFLMRFTSEEKLKSIINTFQIAMTIIMMGGYQILPRLMNFTSMEKITMGLDWWAIFIPPMWLAAPVKLYHDGDYQSIYWIATALAIIVPLVSWWAISRYLTPYFTNKLIDLGTNSSAIPAVAEKVTASRNRLAWLTKLITLPGLERASYSLVTQAYSRDRKLKLRIYPSIGLYVVMVFVFMWSGKKEMALDDFLAQLPTTQYHLLIIYTSILILMIASFEVSYSEEFKSAWVFQSAPIKQPGEIISGTMKASFVTFFLPIYLFSSAVVLLIWGPRTLGDIFFGLTTCYAILQVLNIVGEKHLPLSLSPIARNKGGSIARMFIIVLFIGIVSALHYALTKLGWAIWPLSFIAMAGTYFVQRLIQKIKWEDIRF